MAGLSHVVTVQLGHSDDAVQLVLEKYGERSVDMVPQLSSLPVIRDCRALLFSHHGQVFMDQRGTATTLHWSQHLACDCRLWDTMTHLMPRRLSMTTCRTWMLELENMASDAQRGLWQLSIETDEDLGLESGHQEKMNILADNAVVVADACLITLRLIRWHLDFDVFLL